jgi:hypothetical protein
MTPHQSAKQAPSCVPGTRGRRCFVPACMATLAAVLALGVAAGPAFAFGGPPQLVYPSSFGNEVGTITRTSVSGPFHASFITEDLETTLRLEWSTSESGPWTLVPGGTETAPPDKSTLNGVDYFSAGDELAGLSPETIYYLKLMATNSAGSASEIGHFETSPLRPGPKVGTIRNVTATSAYIPGEIKARGFATHWRFEYATSENGEFHVVPGGEGTITKAQAEALRDQEGPESSAFVNARLDGLNGATSYYVRLFAESEPGLGRKEVTSAVVGFETAAPPSATTFAVHALHGEALRLLGFVTSGAVSTTAEQTLSIEGAPTGGTFALSFDGQRTGASGEGDLAADGAATGSGDLSFANGRGEIIEGSKTVTDVTTEQGAFTVGETIEGRTVSFLPNTTITAVGAGTLTLSAPADETAELGLEGRSKTVTDVTTETGAFAVGQGISGAGIGAGATITAVGAGTITLSGDAQAAGTAVALTARSNTITDLITAAGMGTLAKGSDEVTSVSTAVGRFVVGDRVTGTGVPPETKITAVSGSTLTLSQSATASGAEALSSSGPEPFVVGEAVSGAGIPAGATITNVGEAALTLSASVTASGTGVALTAEIPYDADGGTVGRALTNLPGEPHLSVEGDPGGPYTVLFGASGVNEPLIVADGSGLTPSGSVVVASTQAGGTTSYDARYDFEYVGEKQFEDEGEWAKAASTPELPVGPLFVGEDLPALEGGETYHYRIALASTFPGSPVIAGQEQTLTVPVAGKTEGGEEVARPTPCPNEALRTGPSANLPGCRAYEQLTPAHKEGAQEPFKFGGASLNSVVSVAEDGDRVALEAPLVNYGSGPGAGQSPYFFSRTSTGWQMTAAASQPEFGLGTVADEGSIFSPDLDQFGFQFSSYTGGSESSEVEFKAGPPGGPYVTVASVPRSQVPSNNEGWVAASADFSKLILQVADHTLLGAATGTKIGADLYEYAGGELRQANVDSAGATIGSCGATIVRGQAEVDEFGGAGSAHAVSADGSRVFFEAVPGSNCSEPKDLYMRVNGAETVDIGAYTFLAAAADGSRVLLENGAGEVFVYETEAASVKPLLWEGARPLSLSDADHVIVSEDLTAIYFLSQVGGPPGTPPISSATDIGHPIEGYSDVYNIFRYDIPAAKLSFLFQADPEEYNPQLSPDGRYFYFQSRNLAGLPGGAIVLGGGHNRKESERGGYAVYYEPTVQLYRYDSVEDAVECMSCASASDLEPKLWSIFGESGSDSGLTRNGAPARTLVSADGSRAFFETPAALVPSDLDGEVEPEQLGEDGNQFDWSLSSDVYEWRGSGVDGCAHVQGCLALISSGRGGYLNVLLGTAEEGRDVFIYTNSQLVPEDDDTAGDIYDAREDGGFAGPPPRPVECEGDECSTPLAAPVDSTPASLSFSGAGNLAPAASPTPKATKKTTKKKVNTKKKKRKKQAKSKKKHKQARKSTRRRGK